MYQVAIMIHMLELHLFQNTVSSNLISEYLLCNRLQMSLRMILHTSPFYNLLSFFLSRFLKFQYSLDNISARMTVSRYTIIEPVRRECFPDLSRAGQDGLIMNFQ